MVLKMAHERENRRRDGMGLDEVREKYGEEELLGMGDKSPLYRYVV